MNSATPHLSVRLMTFNHAPFIKKAMEGVMMQVTDFSIEVVVGDDFSTDETLEIIRTFKSTSNIEIRILERIKGDNYWQARQNYGRIYNFTNIIDNCRGEYIALLDGDDYWTDPYKLQKQVDFLKKNKDYIVTYHDSKIINEEGRVIGNSKLQDKNKKDLSALQLMQGHVPKTLTVCFRNVIENFPPEQKLVNNGDVFVMSLLGNYGRGKYLNNINPGCYRKHDGGVWSLADKEEKQLSKIHTYRQLYNYYKRIGNKTMMKYFKNRVRNHKKILISHYLKRKKYFAAGNYFLQLLKG